jgi:hypothetical protein
MNFEFVLKKVIAGFEKENIHYALIGGFALGLLGIPRATMDLDFLIQKEDLDKLDGVLTSLGYKLYFRSENVSHYRGKNPDLGSLDFIHAFRKISLSMLKNAQDKKFLGGKFCIKILQAEDIIGLKIQAIANDPKRKLKELADIEALINVYRDKFDWDKLKEYFSLFEMEEEFRDFKEKFLKC